MNSTANNKLTSSVGMSATFRTTISRIIDALGTLTADIEAIMAVKVIVQRSPNSNVMPFNWAIK